jgi:hypothetical protein
VSRLTGWLVALGVLLALVWSLQTGARLGAEVKAGRRQIDSLSKIVRVDTVRVTKTVTKWRTLSDTLERYLRDTVPVPVEVVREVKAACDSLANACAASQASSARLIKAQSDQITRLGKKDAWWRPKVGLGGAAGVDVSGKPNAVVGVFLGWEF